MTSPLSTDSQCETVTYTDPHEFIHDVVHGTIPLEQVSMQKWIHGTIMAMIQKNQPNLDLTIAYGGGTYKFHHCIQVVNPPVGDVGAILEDMQ